MSIDVHVHLCLDGVNFQQTIEKYKNGDYTHIRKALEEYKKRNIYAIRDGGYVLDMSETIREIAQESGIIYKTPIYSFYKEGYYGNFIGKSVKDIRDFKMKFHDLIKKKPNNIKIILTGLVDFKNYGNVGETGFSFEELHYMIQTAKDLNLPAMVHANSSQAVKMAIEAGADTIEHGYYMTENELYLMVENNVIWVPTLAPLGNLLNNNTKKYKKQLSNIKKIIEHQINNIKTAHKIGVEIAIGSDAGSYSVYHGQGFYDEIKYFKNTEIPVNELHRMAINNGIHCLKLKGEELKFLFEKIK